MIAGTVIDWIIGGVIGAFLLSFVVWTTVMLVKYWNDPYLKQPFGRPYLEALHEILCENRDIPPKCGK